MFLLDAMAPEATFDSMGALMSVIILLTPFIIGGIVFLIIFTSIRRKRKKSQAKQ